MSDSSDPADGERVERPPPRRATLRLVLGVAVLFALLGGLLVRIAAGARLGGFLGVAVAVLVLAAATAVFGPGALREASNLLRP